jgi:hypothetical protein
VSDTDRLIASLARQIARLEERLGRVEHRAPLMGIIGNKVRVTVDGGIAILCKAEVALVAGEVVQASDTGTYGSLPYVEKNAMDGDMPIGVVYAAAAQDADVWVVVAGMANVLPEAANTLAQADIIYSSNATAGRVDSAAAIPSVEFHNREIGHVLVDGTGAGAAALCVLHWN